MCYLSNQIKMSTTERSSHKNVEIGEREALVHRVTPVASSEDRPISKMVDLWTKKGKRRKDRMQKSR
uniref:Ovule protein n=1 Tax=Steinernema glaseri TaxID=37863 RepID=A0A1I7ZLX8_9BILA